MAIAPHSGSGGCAPSPRKPRPAAVRITDAIDSVSRTSTEGMHIGTIDFQMIRPLEAPCSFAAET